MKDDTISRWAVIRAVDKHTREDGTLDDDISCILEDLSSAQPEQKPGKWIPYRCDMYKCSKCGYIYTELTDLHRCGAKYCPNCGEPMSNE